MNITPAQRNDIETALDELFMVMAPANPFDRHRVTRRYQKAIAIIRDRPAGFRKIRSDEGDRRPTPQREIEV